MSEDQSRRDAAFRPRRPLLLAAAACVLVLLGGCNLPNVQAPPDVNRENQRKAA